MRLIHLIIFLSYFSTAFAQEKKPNIIFILTDDQRWDALGYAGNTVIKTPNMDNLAKEGLYFKNAFVTTPICAASRATIMTGLYERSHDYTFQKPPLQQEFIDSSYFALLQKAGYYNGFLGKLGVKFDNGSAKKLFDIFQPESQNHYFTLSNGSTEHMHLTDKIGNNAVSFIEDAPKDKPFCLNISFHAPHAVDQSPDQYVWPQALDSLYEDVIFEKAKMSDDPYFNQLPEKVRLGFNRTRWKWRFDSPEKYQKMMKGYYRMISGVDENIKKIRAALAKENLDQNTIIILIGDNGYFLGERQLAGKWLMYEPSLRVPLIIYNPLTKDKRTVDDMVLNLDMAPTILDFAGVPIPASYEGLSLSGYAGNKDQRINRTSFICEHLWKFEPIPPSEGIRTKRYKYFRYIDNPEIEEFYDLMADPDEKNNLRNNPLYTEVLNKIKGEFELIVKEVDQKQN